MPFDEDAEDVPLSRFGFRPAERFLYVYDFVDGWEAEIRVEKVIDEAVSDEKLTPRCIAGREPAPPDGSGGPRRYAERSLDTASPILTDDMRTVGDVLVRIADGDDNAGTVQSLGRLVQPRYDRAGCIWLGGIIDGVGFAIGRNRP